MTYLSIIDAWRFIFNMRFVRNRRRALSTVVTTAIMLTAVAAIGTGVVAWSNTSLRTYEFNLATSASDKTNKINEVLIIENVVLQPNSPILGQTKINITVTNTGTIGFNVTQIQVSYLPNFVFYNNNVKLCSYFTCSTSTNALPPHSSGWFEYPLTGTVTNKIVTVQVTTVRGTT